jgi:AAA family ATP:ADP antiporter
MSPREASSNEAAHTPAVAGTGAVVATRASGTGTPLDRLLNVFAEVRPGEGLTAVLLMMNVFLLLAGYYLLKTIREPLVLAAEGGGAEVKSYASAAIAGLLIVLVPVYGALASRVSRVKLINGVTAFFIVCLAAFFVWARAVGVAGAPPADGAAVPPPAFGQLALGIAFFIWVGIYNLMIVAQFWSFANDVYTVEQGKRLFAIVAVGASLGAIAGSAVAKPLIERFGLYPLMAIAAGMLVLCMVITNLVHGREKAVESGVAAKDATDEAARESGREEHDANSAIKGKNGFSLVLADKYLLLIAALMLLLNLVNTTGEYILGETLTHIGEGLVARGQLTHEDLGKWVGAFYGGYFTWVNIISAVLQAFFVSRIIKWFGVRVGLLLMPIVSLAAYATLAFIPVLGIIRTAKIAENSLDYSVNNTARQSLFLPTTREAKYKAKQAVDTFFVRLGDVLSAGLVFAGTTWLAFRPQHFAMVNAVFVVLWLVVAIFLGRMFRERSNES